MNADIDSYVISLFLHQYSLTQINLTPTWRQVAVDILNNWLVRRLVVLYTLLPICHLAADAVDYTNLQSESVNKIELSSSIEMIQSVTKTVQFCQLKKLLKQVYRPSIHSG